MCFRETGCDVELRNSGIEELITTPKRGYLLKKCLPWFKKHLVDAANNAAKNGFKGARWPKMIADTAILSKSPVVLIDEIENAVVCNVCNVQLKKLQREVHKALTDT